MANIEYCRVIQEDGKLLLVDHNGKIIPKQIDINVSQNMDMVHNKTGLAEVTVTLWAKID